MLTYILFVAGFFALIYGADWLVDGASALARRFNISDMVIGLTIVSLGTSMPEMVVSVYANLQGNAGIATGNVLGSNIFNTFVILGVAAAIAPLAIQRSTMRVDIPFNLLVVVAFAALANDGRVVARGEGVALLAFFAIFMYYNAVAATREPEEGTDQSAEGQMPIWKAALLIVVGIVGLMLGGQWIVDGAVALARVFGMSEAFISLTIIATGTSLPELATSAVAANKGNADVAVGNVVGSNIFNLLFVLGVGSAISPLDYAFRSNYDLLLGAVGLVLVLAFAGRGRLLKRWHGLTLIALYVVYVGFLLASGT